MWNNYKIAFVLQGQKKDSKLRSKIFIAKCTFCTLSNKDFKFIKLRIVPSWPATKNGGTELKEQVLVGFNSTNHDIALPR